MDADTIWGIIGLIGVGALVYQLVTWVKRIQKEEAAKDAAQPHSIVYRN